MKVGFQGYQYTIRRNIVGLVKNIDYIRVYDLFEIVRKFGKAIAIITRGVGPDLHDLQFAYLDGSANRVDLLHFWNVISFSKTPWISTFETALPRYKRALMCHHGKQPTYASLKEDKKIRRALDAISGPACKRIIASSECCAKIQREMLRQFPEYSDVIERKMLVLHPPQAVFFERYANKGLSYEGPIQFLFVGNSFFRKGGMEMLEAFEQLKREGYPLALTIVSSLAIDNYASQETLFDVEKAKKIIDANCDWIIYHYSLPNQKLLDLMKISHVGLLPTYADTYGYSVLEFQASGCPVISTDVRALPEINNETIGWIINLRKNGLGEAIYTSDRDRSEIAETIAMGIAEIIRSIFCNRKVIESKADAALERIKTEHSPQTFAERLQELYLDAVRQD